MAKAAVGLVCVVLATAIPFERGTAQTGGFDAGFGAYAAGDYAAALDAWRPLAKAGDAEAQHGLGLMYQTGRGVESDLAQAAAWFRRAAEQGFARAQTALGDVYARGDGVVGDMGEALAWWRKAAEQGSVRAQYSLGEAYFEGQGVAVDLDESAAWLARAAEQGYARARAKLKDVMRLRRDAGVAVADPEPPEAPAAPPAPAAAEAPSPPAGPVEAAAAPPEADAEDAAVDGAPPTDEPRETAEESPPETAAPAATETVAPAATETAAPAASETAAAPTYRVHLASFREKETADKEWHRLRKSHGDLLAGLTAIVGRVDLGATKGVYFRLHAGPLADAEAAQALCRALSKRRVRCRVAPPA